MGNPWFVGFGPGWPSRGDSVGNPRNVKHGTNVHMECTLIPPWGIMMCVHVHTFTPIWCRYPQTFQTMNPWDRHDVGV